MGQRKAGPLVNLSQTSICHCISQGNVATRLRCGGIFNTLPNYAAKQKTKNRSAFVGVTRKRVMARF